MIIDDLMKIISNAVGHVTDEMLINCLRALAVVSTGSTDLSTLMMANYEAL